MTGARAKLDGFVRTLRDVPWLANAAKPDTDARVIRSVQVAAGFRAQFSLWPKQSIELETLALKEITDRDIDEVFQVVSDLTDAPVRAAIDAMFERLRRPTEAIEGVEGSLDAWMRDLLIRDAAWAAVEYMIGREDFFHELFAWHQRGRWPVSWDGRYPHGNIVVL